MSPGSRAGAFARQLCSIVRGLPGAPAEGVIPLHEPLFEGSEWAYVKECIDTGWVSSAGSFVDEFEGRLADYTGAPHAVVTVNGTSALHIALHLVGVRPGDEVLVPALTFVATANAVSYCGAIPHFVDSDETTFGIDPEALSTYLAEVGEVRDGTCVNRETGRPIRAVVPMHTFGHPLDLDALENVCQTHGLEMVEDAAESLGSLYRGQHTGTRGRLGTLSFNGNKVVTTGGGGAILTSDGELAERAKHLTSTAKKDHQWAYVHDRVGYNYRMPNLNAALGCAQLEQLPAFLDRKRRLANHYEQELANLPHIRFFKEPGFATSNYWLNSILLEPDDLEFRNAVLAQTHQQGILCRPAWTLMPDLPMYGDSPCAPLPTARSLGRRLINLPSSAGLWVDHAGESNA